MHEQAPAQQLRGFSAMIGVMAVGKAEHFPAKLLDNDTAR